MLIASPGLISLKLYLSLHQSPLARPKFPADALVTSLGNQLVFTSLHTFHLRGTLEFNWDAFFTHTSTSTSPLRAFFSRHSGIQDLVLDSNHCRPYPGEIQPHDLSQLFPSLKHFEGPAFLCKPLVSSPLAGQFQTLVIMDEILYKGTGLREIAEDGKPLPRLRQLTISAWSAKRQVVLRVSALKTLLQASVQLEKLETNADLYDYVGAYQSCLFPSLMTPPAIIH